MRTTFGRTLVALAAILLAAILLVGVSFQFLVRNFMAAQAMDSLKGDCAVIADVAAAYAGDDGLRDENFLITLSIVSRLSDADAVICDKSGRLVACSDAPLGCEHQGLVIGQDYLNKVMKGGYVMTSGVMEGLYEDARYVVATPIVQSGEKLGIVIASTPMTATMRVLKRLSDTFLFVSALVVAVCAIVAIFYARKHSSPLRELSRAAVDFGHGNLKARVSIPRGATDEVQELALAFNNMAASLEKSEDLRQEFVANVSHELKTPMTTIGGYVDGILDGTIAPEQQNHYLQIVSDETKRLSRLVRSMLDISRLQERGVPEDMKTRFDIGECVGRVLLTFEQKITSKYLDVQASLPEYPLYVRACADQITQVIYNLVDNAVKFCPEGGTLGLRVRQGGNKVYVTVSNDGQTIPAQELPLLFNRFHKLDKSRSRNRDGWGLGLYIAKTIICSHGGDISVSSKDGVTEFTFTLTQVN